MKSISILMLIAVLAFIGCSQKLELTEPEPMAPLVVTADVHPDTIPVSYGAGLYSRVEGAQLPLAVAEWSYGGQLLSHAAAITFVPESEGSYTFSYRVKDAAGRDTTVFATLIAVPLDSIFVPPDTVTLPPDTVIVIEHDTTFVFDTTIVTDTLVRVDTTTVIDTLVINDTTFIVDTAIVYDTVTVVDTVFQEIYIVDTVYTDNLLYKACRPWLIKVDDMSISVRLGNPNAGTYTLAAFRKRLTDALPNDLELKWDFGNGQIAYTSVHGDTSLVESFWNVTLPVNAKVIISFEKPSFAGKVLSPTCWEYFKGNWFWLSQPVPE